MGSSDPIAGPQPDGRRLGPRAPVALKLLRAAFGLVGRGLLGFRLELVGAEHLPRDDGDQPIGGWIAAGLPHVTWIEPFVMLVLLPIEPRLVWFGDARAMDRSWLRRFAFRQLGGVVPIFPGGGPEAFDDHVAKLRAVVDGGAVFALFPERGPAVPPGEARPLAPGIGYFGLRSGAPIVPMVFGGTHELYRGRRIQLRILPAVWATDLAAEASLSGAVTDEREAAHAVAATLHALTVDAVADAHRATESARGARKRWRWLTHAFR
ncbi:MAG TPA: lysophospholipid acyltransferase family protein [Candidatus Saccharimonadia bacterium]|nr:lysophospholipid acyltransferase family protein [Candidatus Saccharimonadia bacterium]